MASPFSSSSSSSSSSAAKSQPLHNFELSPLLKWNSKDGRYARNPKRCRSMKSPPHHRPHSSPLRRSPPPRFEPPQREFTVGVPRFQTHLMREPRATLPPPPVAAAEDERKDSAMEGEFERMSLIQEENLRHYRGRDWWSESEKSDVIAYRRNPMRKSGFSPAKFGSSSNPNLDGRRSDAAGDYEVYGRRERYSWFSNSDEGRSKSPVESFRNHFKKSAFTFSSESKAAESKKSSKKYAFSSSSSSNSAADENPKNPLKKSGFSSPKKQHPYSNVEEKKPKAAETLKTPLKKTGFSSPKKHSSSSNAEDKKKSMAAEGDAVVKDKEERSNHAVAVADADASPKRKSSSSPLELEEKRVDEKKPKEEANPKTLPLKKSAFFGKLDKSKAAAAAAAAAAKECEAAKLKTTDSKRGKEEEKKEKEKEKVKEKEKEMKKEKEKEKVKEKEKEKEKAKEKVKEKEKEEKDDEDFGEEIKVWNLRPRNVNKTISEKPSGGGGGGGSSKSKARAKPAAGGGGEKKEKKKPLSIAISLTKQEIEEDIFALTGAKPSRRPKKRPKNVQKQLDAVFPGLYLLSITSDSYKVSENSLKG